MKSLQFQVPMIADLILVGPDLAISADLIRSIESVAIEDGYVIKVSCVDRPPAILRQASRAEAEIALAELVERINSARYAARHAAIKE